MTKAVYLVQRLNWEGGFDGHFDNGEYNQSTPVRAFLLREDAEACREQLEEQVRSELSPFTFADLIYGETEVSSLNQKEILAAVQKLGLPRPRKRNLYSQKFFDWRAWWDDNVESMTPEQVQQIWALFDRLTFYEVVESELDE